MPLLPCLVPSRALQLLSLLLFLSTSSPFSPPLSPLAGAAFGAVHSSSSSSNLDAPRRLVSSSSSSLSSSSNGGLFALRRKTTALLSSSSASQVSSFSSHILGNGDPSHVPSKLQEIAARRVSDVSALKSPSSVSSLKTKLSSLVASLGPPLDLFSSIKSSYPAMSLAAEFKRASPSKGLLTTDLERLEAAETAAKYYEAGASIISVLTEPTWFKGNLDDLEAVRRRTQADAASSSSPSSPSSPRRSRPLVLRKDFVLDEYQVLEAAAHGADTVLLIVAITPTDVLKRLIDCARGYGMEPLVEVHEVHELAIALEAGARVIGINNRDLHTFALDAETTVKLASHLSSSLGVRFDPADPKAEVLLCSLSGMSTSDDVQRYRECGIAMCLIGEALMRSDDPSAAIASLRLDPRVGSGVKKTPFPVGGGGGGGDSGSAQGVGVSAAVGCGAYNKGLQVVKVCGVTNGLDATNACRSGAGLVGVIFAAGSKRVVTAEQAKDVVKAVRAFGERNERVVVPDVEWTDSVPLMLARKAAALVKATKGGARPLVVGVFQDTDPKTVNRLVAEVGLDLVQLHGKEGYGGCSLCDVPVILAVGVEEGREATTGVADDIVDRGGMTADPLLILLDTAVGGIGGGLGKTFDWDVVRGMQARGVPVMVAGGVNVDNVEALVKGYRPFGVDTCGGVELDGIKGRKDLRKLDVFVKNAKRADVEAN